MSKYDNVQMDKIAGIKLHIENNSHQMDEIVDAEKKTHTMLEEAFRRIGYGSE